MLFSRFRYAPLQLHQANNDFDVHTCLMLKKLSCVGYGLYVRPVFKKKKRGLHNALHNALSSHRQLQQLFRQDKAVITIHGNKLKNCSTLCCCLH